MARLFGNNDKVTEAGQVLTLLRGDLEGLVGSSHPPITLDPTVEDVLDLSPTQVLSAESTLAQGDIWYADATPKLVLLNVGSTGDYLRVSAGGVPEWDAGAVVAHDLLSVSHGDTNAQAVTRGSIIIANSTPAWDELTVGGADQFLYTDGTDVSWHTLGAGDLPDNAANPSATIGLTVVNGSASTWMRSDGAPPLSQAITPTWSGAHIHQANVSLHSGADLIVYSDAGSTEVGRWDGATGDLSLDGDVTMLTDQWIGLGAASTRIVFESAGNEVELRNAADLVLYSDDGSTEVGRWDGAAGHITLDGDITVEDDAWIGLGSSAGRIVFDSTTTPDTVGVYDAQLRVYDSSSNILFNIAEEDGEATFILRSSATSGTDNQMTFRHYTSGTPAAGFGSDFFFDLESTAGDVYAAALLKVIWATATHASRKGRLILYSADYVGFREGIRIESSGTAPMLGFYGSNATARQTISGARDVPEAALADLLTALATLGLITDSTTAS